MVKSKKRLWLLGGISILGMMFGFFSDNKNIPSINQSGERMHIPVVFFGSLACMLFASAFEQITIHVGRFLRRAVGGQQSFQSMFSAWGDPVIDYMSWFLLSLGIGLGISALWREPNRFWTGLIYFAIGTGLSIGYVISKWLSKKLDVRRNF